MPRLIKTLTKNSMFSISKHRPAVLGVVLMMVVIATAQSQPDNVALFVQGYSGQANVFQSQGRLLVDVQELARITNGSLHFERGRIVLTLAPGTTSETASNSTGKSGFSPAFTRAAIEAMASIREWGGTLQVVVENGYPVGKAMAGNSIRAYEGRAADSIALAASVASTDSDRRGLELLRNEFNNVQAWAESFVNARNEMRAVNLTMSEHPLQDDEQAQKMMHCGQFLAQMFAGATFQDDPACH
jgi:hypothetical protein